MPIAVYRANPQVYGDRDPAVLKKRPACRNAQELFAAKPLQAQSRSWTRSIVAQAKNEAGATRRRSKSSTASTTTTSTSTSANLPFHMDAHKNALLDFLHLASTTATAAPSPGSTKDAHKNALDFLAVPPDGITPSSRPSLGRRREVATGRRGVVGRATAEPWPRACSARRSSAGSRATCAPRPPGPTTVVVSPVQVLATKERPRRPRRFEFPDDRARLLRLLANRSALIVSGDVQRMASVRHAPAAARCRR